MSTRFLNASDRPLLREATLANMNWCGLRFSFNDLDQSAELAHYYSTFPDSHDFGMLEENNGEVRAAARGLPGISLSVEDGNRARSLYSRLGFQVVGRSGNSDTMLLRLPRPA
jgi:hypothetical protein